MVSVDTKKKEIVGEFFNGGTEWHPAGEPTRTKTHDFVDKELGRAVPYGVYDLANDEGWVSVGDTADTASFAVEAIRRWWASMGRPRLPAATKLLITADAGGSNGYRVELWKVELAQLAEETGLEITVVHYPPGTSKWNRIEHKMFSFISMNWHGRPLVSYRTIVELISNTTTAKGLRIRAEETSTTTSAKAAQSRRRTGPPYGNWRRCRNENFKPEDESAPPSDSRSGGIPKRAEVLPIGVALNHASDDAVGRCLLVHGRREVP